MNEEIIKQINEIEKEQIRAYNIFTNQMSKTFNKFQKLKKELKQNLVDGKRDDEDKK
jgi:hypothetical protein